MDPDRPRRNRVTPLGKLVAHPARGLVFGNRGVLHDAEGRIRRGHQGRRWIACRLAFRGRRRPLSEPGRYTGLFFLDEATAWAAGHRPCAECRHAAYVDFLAAWRAEHGPATADDVDRRLHAERLDPDGRRRLHRAGVGELPDGVIVLHDGAAHLRLGGTLRHWAPDGYGPPVPLPTLGSVEVVTPPSLVAVLHAGWTSDLPFVHPSAHEWPTGSCCVRP